MKQTQYIHASLLNLISCLDLYLNEKVSLTKLNFEHNFNPMFSTTSAKRLRPLQCDVKCLDRDR